MVCHPALCAQNVRRGHCRGHRALQAAAGAEVRHRDVRVCCLRVQPIPCSLSDLA